MVSPTTHACGHDHGRILIIGAGLGGLALAHGLLKARIPFRIFERDPSPSFRAQGYRIRINPAGAAALQRVLSPEQWAKFERSCAETRLGASSLDALTGETAEGFLPGPRREQLAAAAGGGGIPRPKLYTADRIVLRSLLLRGLEEEGEGGGMVAFGKVLREVGVVPDEDRKGVELVIAKFADGTVERGRLLIGADGLRSVVRRRHFHHIPQLRPVDTGGRCIYGKTLLTAELENRLHATCLEKVTVAVEKVTPGGPTAPLALFLEPIRFPKNDGRPEPQHPADYVYWVLLSRKGVFAMPDDAFLNLSGAEAAQFSLKMTQHWDPAIRALLELQEPRDTSCLRICSTVPEGLVRWGQTSSASRVTLLGDAIHAMSPAGGIGANTALRDAAGLAGILAESGGTIEEGVDKYERLMREYAAEALASSYEVGKAMFDQKPFDECEPVEFESV